MTGAALLVDLAGRGRAILATVAVLALPMAGAHAQGARDGARLYDDSCAGCHGRRGQETARGQARRLDTVPAAELRDYLIAKRNIDAPARPYERLKKALTDAEIEALVNHAARFRNP